MPFWMENTAGGPNLRGYLYQQFRGDSQMAAHAEYHFPLFSISSLDFRGLAFYDVQAIWFRNLPRGVRHVRHPRHARPAHLPRGPADGYPPGADSSSTATFTRRSAAGCASSCARSRCR